jgi:hypothetical protein
MRVGYVNDIRLFGNLILYVIQHPFVASNSSLLLLLLQQQQHLSLFYLPTL